jgi:hypothetical protein
MSNEKEFYVYNFNNRELEYEMSLEVKLSSVSFSQDSRYLLVNKFDGEAQMFDIITRESIRSFDSGVKGGNYIIKGSFGGANESFVTVGSESISKTSIIYLHKILTLWQMAKSTSGIKRMVL